MNGPLKVLLRIIQRVHLLLHPRTVHTHPQRAAQARRDLQDVREGGGEGGGGGDVGRVVAEAESFLLREGLDRSELGRIRGGEDVDECYVAVAFGKRRGESALGGEKPVVMEDARFKQRACPLDYTVRIPMRDFTRERRRDTHQQSSGPNRELPR